MHGFSPGFLPSRGIEGTPSLPASSSSIQMPAFQPVSPTTAEHIFRFELPPSLPIHSFHLTAKLVMLLPKSLAVLSLTALGCQSAVMARTLGHADHAAARLNAREHSVAQLAARPASSKGALFPRTWGKHGEVCVPCVKLPT